MPCGTSTRHNFRITGKYCRVRNSEFTYLALIDLLKDCDVITAKNCDIVNVLGFKMRLDDCVKESCITGS